MGCLLCVLKFIFIIQLLYYHYFLILFRATHMNCYHYYCVAVMHQYTFLLYLVLQRNIMCQQNKSHEAEVLRTDVSLQKENHSIEVQVCFEVIKPPASVRRYKTTSPSLVLQPCTHRNAQMYAMQASPKYESIVFQACVDALQLPEPVSQHLLTHQTNTYITRFYT